MPTKTTIMAVPWDQQRVTSARCLMIETGGLIIWDEKHDAFDTWQRTLREAGDDPVIMLEDDVMLTANWREKIEKVIDQHCSSVIQFFSNRSADTAIGSRWEAGRTFRMNQCYYLPAGAASALWRASQDWHETDVGAAHPTGYDLAMADWMGQTKQRYWLSVPSLVQHQPWASQIGRRSSARQSRTFR